MLEHIPETKLEQYLIFPDDVPADEVAKMEVHLRECTLCREYARKLRAFYQQVRSEMGSSPSERDKALAERLMARKRFAIPERTPERHGKELSIVDAYAEIIEPYRRPMMQRFARYIYLHPVRSATGFSLAAAALVATFFAVQPSKDTNPTYHKVLRQVLYVYNKDDEVLWTKNARGMPDDSSKFNPDIDEGNPRFIRVFDIDGDSQNEILVTNNQAGDLSSYLKPYDFAPDTLYCFNGDGSLRWKHGMSGGMRFGAIDFSKNPNWQVQRFLPIRRTPSEPVQLFVTATPSPSWPCKIMELDTRTGKELHSYWHAGQWTYALEADVESDGIKELVLAGVNNYLKATAIAVLDPLHVQGAGPTIPEVFPTEAGKGTEKYYLLLPRSSFSNVLSELPYGRIKNIAVSQGGGITATTIETNRDEYDGGFVYGFGDHMRVNYVVANDPLEVSFEKARRQGFIKEELNAAYYENLKKSVRYWDGEKFVKEPVRNKYYLAAKRLP